mmetsp:Transcript_27970/g.59899  ORF Transcript_27970/g.59899 Transcript_27970/m.59899 type:complete len:98 (-) Transcript_27970:212-505(-)
MRGSEVPIRWIDEENKRHRPLLVAAGAAAAPLRDAEADCDGHERIRPRRRWQAFVVFAKQLWIMVVRDNSVDFVLECFVITARINVPCVLVCSFDDW